MAFVFAFYASPGFYGVSNENVVSNDVTDDWTLLHSHSHSCVTFRPAGLLPISGNQSDDRTMLQPMGYPDTVVAIRPPSFMDSFKSCCSSLQAEHVFILPKELFAQSTICVHYLFIY